MWTISTVCNANATRPSPCEPSVRCVMLTLFNFMHYKFFLIFNGVYFSTQTNKTSTVVAQKIRIWTQLFQRIALCYRRQHSHCKWWCSHSEVFKRSCCLNTSRSVMTWRSRSLMTWRSRSLMTWRSRSLMTWRSRSLPSVLGIVMVVHAESIPRSISTL